MNGREYNSKVESISRLQEKIQRGITYTVLAGCLTGVITTVNGCNRLFSLEEPPAYSTEIQLRENIYYRERVASKLDDLANDPFFVADTSTQRQFGLLKTQAEEQAKELQRELSIVMKNPEIKEYGSNIKKYVNRAAAGTIIFFSSLLFLWPANMLNDVVAGVRYNRLNRKHYPETANSTNL